MSGVKKVVVPIRRAIWLMAVVLISRGLCVYELCYDNTSGEPAACEATSQEVISTVSFSLSVSPSVTCGDPVSTYRRLGQASTVLTCDNSTQLRHPPSYMTDGDSSSWWQSITMAAAGHSQPLHANITLSFGKLYTLEGGLTITFNSDRPETMLVEKSADGGVTWSPLQYYARDCQKFESEQPSSAVRADNPAAVICDSTYTEPTTSSETGGRVIFPSLMERLSALLGVPTVTTYARLRDYYIQLDSTEVTEFLTFTDLRFRLLEPATDGMQNYDMYYYAISDIRVKARCSCNLHANTCTANSAGRQECTCQHHTAGRDCERCLPLYNDRPWQRGQYSPFDSGTANECQKCQCNDHAISCVYDPGYGRGVCEGCTHNTRGRHCELCADGFYANESLPLNHAKRCAACDCDSAGSVQGVPCKPEGGQCPCKPGMTGRKCDTCLPGYYNFSENGCVETVAALVTNDTTNSTKLMVVDLPPVRNVSSGSTPSPEDRLLFAENIITAVDSQTASLSDILELSPSPQTNKTVVYSNLPVYVTVGVIGVVVVVLFAMFLGLCWKRAARRKARGCRRKSYSLSTQTSPGPLRRLTKLLPFTDGNDVTLTRWAERRPYELSGEVNYGSDFCQPVFYIDSGESTDGDSLQRGSKLPHSAAVDKREMEVVKGRLDPNSELQRKSKLPSFSALDRKRKERLRKADAFDEDEEGIPNPSFDVTRASSPSVAVVAPLTKPAASPPIHNDNTPTMSSLKSSFPKPALCESHRSVDLTQESGGLSGYPPANSEPVFKKAGLQPSYSVPVRPSTLVIPDSVSTVDGSDKTAVPLAKEAVTSVPETGSGKRAPKKPRRRKPPSNVSDTLKSGSDVTDVSRNSSAVSLRLYDTCASDSECGELSESSAEHRESVPLSRSVRPPATEVHRSQTSPPAPLTAAVSVPQSGFAGLEDFDEVRGSLV